LKRIKDANPELSFNENTIAKDFIVFLNMYKSDSENTDVEDSFSGILSEIGMLRISYTQDDNGKKVEQFQIENNERDNLPGAVVLFSILNNPSYGNSISLKSLEFYANSPGSIFALSRTGLINKISDIVRENKSITFTDHGGIKELQFKTKPNAYSILDEYYGK